LVLTPSPAPCSFTAPPPSPLYPLSLHDALPISADLKRLVHGRAKFSWFSLARATNRWARSRSPPGRQIPALSRSRTSALVSNSRSEEHTSELQSRFDLVCRLLLEKKKKQNNTEL